MPVKRGTEGAKVRKLGRLLGDIGSATGAPVCSVEMAEAALLGLRRDQSAAINKAVKIVQNLAGLPAPVNSRGRCQLCQRELKADHMGPNPGPDARSFHSADCPWREAMALSQELRRWNAL